MASIERTDDLRHLVVQGVRIPTLLYGTAWKEEATQRLTQLALDAGFRGVDTANQRRHYVEAGVGAALEQVLAHAGLSRDDLFIQTKFTHRPGQDHRLPYDPAAPISEQVAQSFDSSLAHLGVRRLDAYLLHGPMTRMGLASEDLEAWGAMEALHDEGRVRLLGVSNVSAEQLDLLCEHARVPPAIVQNRCYARLGWDAKVRACCRRRGIVYQGFSLLTANPEVLAHPQVQRVAERAGCSPAQLIFRAAVEHGLVALTGTTSAEHMRQDLAVYDLDLGQKASSLIAQLTCGEG